MGRFRRVYSSGRRIDPLAEMPRLPGSVYCNQYWHWYLNVSRNISAIVAFDYMHHVYRIFYGHPWLVLGGFNRYEATPYAKQPGI
jgi:hypothetical protein